MNIYKTLSLGFLLGFGAMTVSAVPYPLPQTTPFTYSNALSVGTNDNTHVMVGYAIWFAPTGYDWATGIYNPSNNLTWKNNTWNDLQAGIDPAGDPTGVPGNKLCATPDLPPSVQAATGLSAGYYSDNAAVIAHHNTKLQELGADIIVPDLTNLTATDFTYAERNAGYDNNHPQAFKALMQTLNGLSNPVRVVPCLGVLQSADLTVESGADGFSHFQRSLLFVLNELQQHSKLAVIYEASDSPLIIVYHGVWPSFTASTDAQANALRSLGYKFTLKHMIGFGESINSVWANPSTTAARPLEPFVQLQDNMWTWCDRLYSQSYDGFSTYTNVPGGSRTEFVAVTPKSPQEGSTTAESTPTRGGEVVYAQMTLARKAHPLFLFLSEYNHFISHDSGFHVETARDIEPTKEWGSQIFDMMKNAVTWYREYEANSGRPRFSEISVRGLAGTGADQMILGFGTSGSASMRVVTKAMGPSLAAFFGNNTSITVADPKLDLYNSAQLLGSNDSWGTFNHTPSGNTVSMTNVRILPNSPYYTKSLNYGQTLQSNEAAITGDLKPDQSYSVLLSDQGGNGRVGHLRVVTSDSISDSRITHHNGRANVQPGNGVLILGFHLDRGMAIGIRGSGPSLAAFGLSPLEDPRVEIRDGSGSLVAASDDIDAGTKASLQTRYGGWTIDNKESGFANYYLAAGDYTVLLLNQNPSTAAYGIGHLEVMEW